MLLAKKYAHNTRGQEEVPSGGGGGKNEPLQIIVRINGCCFQKKKSFFIEKRKRVYVPSQDGWVSELQQTGRFLRKNCCT